MIFTKILEGFGLGISLGITCLATCGWVYAPFLMERERSWIKSLTTVLEISVGRFLMYVVFGAAAGALGYHIAEINRSWFTAVAYLSFSVLLFISAFRSHRREKGCGVARWSRFADNPFLLGIVTGISFCPSFLIALTRAVDLSGMLSGMLLFIGFFFGTNLFLLPLAAFGFMGSERIFRRIAQIAAVGVSLWFISLAIITLIKNFGIIHEKEQTLRPGQEMVKLLDSTNAVILTDDTSKLALFRDRLRTNRPGSVAFITDSGDIPRSGYLLVEEGWLNETGTSQNVLKRPGLFTVILPPYGNGNEYDDQYSRRVIDFLGRYYFIHRNKTGSLFDMGGFGQFRETDSNHPLVGEKLKLE